MEQLSLVIVFVLPLSLLAPSGWVLDRSVQDSEHGSPGVAHTHAA